MKVHDYRRDHRTVEQFAADIDKGTRAERNIIDRYVQYWEAKTGQRLEVEDNGCDNSGALLSDDSVTTEADYRVGGMPVEIKFNNQRLQRFHLKASQLAAYARQRAAIIWVNGYETERPVFTVLKPITLERIQAIGKRVTFDGWGGKECFVLYADNFVWHDFNYTTTEAAS